MRHRGVHALELSSGAAKRVPIYRPALYYISPTSTLRSGPAAAVGVREGPAARARRRGRELRVWIIRARPRRARICGAGLANGRIIRIYYQYRVRTGM